MKLTKKKIISAIIVSICILIGGLFYFSDPLEYFNNYEIPENTDDIILCYYQADLGSTNEQYYIITRNGVVKVYSSNHATTYDELVEWNKTEAEGLQVEPLTDEQIGYLKKINTNNSRNISKNNPTDIAYPETSYYIIQKYEDQYVMMSIKEIIYNGSLGKDPQVIKKCRSKYTSDICDYIDYAVSLANS
jgi:hypothetical protein